MEGEREREKKKIRSLAVNVRRDTEFNFRGSLGFWRVARERERERGRISGGTIALQKFHAIFFTAHFLVYANFPGMARVDSMRIRQKRKINFPLSPFPTHLNYFSLFLTRFFSLHTFRTKVSDINCIRGMKYQWIDTRFKTGK